MENLVYLIIGIIGIMILLKVFKATIKLAIFVALLYLGYIYLLPYILPYL